MDRSKDLCFRSDNRKNIQVKQQYEKEEVSYFNERKEYKGKCNKKFK